MNQDVFDNAIADLHSYIEDCSAAAKVKIELMEHRPYSMNNMDRSFSEGWRVGFHRCLAEVHRIIDADRLDTYEVRTGSAGFVQLFKNGERIQPKNMRITLRERR